MRLLVPDRDPLFQARMDMSEAHYGHMAAITAEYAPAGWVHATPEADMQRGTDFVMVERRVAGRVRSQANRHRYANQFTLRTQPADELLKLEPGLMVYGWAAVDWQATLHPQWKSVV